MKTLFIPTKAKLNANKSKIAGISKKLPKNLAIAYSIQYEELAKQIKKILEKSHNITALTQVLGCSKPQFKNTQAILLISDGKFHATSLAYETKLPTYILDRNKLEKIPKQAIEDFEKRKKAAYMKFLHADKVGILVSTKPGQENLKKALALKKQLKDKESYIFIANNLDTQELENFPQIQSWINTACPRMDMNNNRIVNIGDLN